MGDFRARIKAKLLRRHSATPTLGSSKPSLGQDRASSSTRTRTSTTGYAASLSTAATNEDRPSNSSIRSNDSPPKKIGNGFGGVGVGVGVGGVGVLFPGPGPGPIPAPIPSPSQAPLSQSQYRDGDQDQDRNRDETETVPPELEKQLNLAGNSNVNNNTDNADKGLKTVAVATNLDGDVDVEIDADVDASASANANSSVNVDNLNNLTNLTNLTFSTPSTPSNKTGKDLQISTINSAPTPAITTPILSLDLNNLNNTISTAATPLPLPSINEHPAAASLLQLKPRILDQNHQHHQHHQQHHHPHQKHQLQHRDNNNDNNNDHDHDHDHENNTTDDDINDHLRLPIPSSRALSPLSRPTGPPRRQSIIPNRQTTFIKTLLHTGNTGNTGYASSEVGPGEVDQLLPISGNMVTRKVWVKRPLASPTLITINEEDLVDDVRDLILRKYANSLGRQYDSPDLTLRICDREQQTSRPLQPDEPMSRTLDAYYPGGQSVDDALLIDIPSRRTPKASPNPRYYADDRPHESATDYFPPYPPAAQHPNNSATTLLNSTHQLHFPPSLTVINGGQLPPLPSPGGTRRLGASRPKIQRMHTASPVSAVPSGLASQQPAAPPIGMHNYPRQPRSRTHSGASSEQSNHPPAAPAISTPPIPERTATPPPRVSSPRLVNRPKKKKPVEHPLLPPGMLNGGVPPINVLIVEDNIINLKLLEAFVKRLKVRWQTAMNGREAVNKWRAGGFHLVLMDIQLPVMSGLEATREIRRIEKVNSIGVFSSSASSPPDEIKAEPAEEDKLVNTEMFKSPVIIVALTASSLQSDRHEALAAGCNDFLTKPVNFVWLERKVMEWGCMQALIDFDGWRKWKDFSQKAVEDDSKKAAAAKNAKAPKKNRLSMTTAAA
ncbi:hypothetical protein F5Y00DRAFT_262795 [Daldinia vernicosa]|uniref:uncharacterized protein n=1 Tax=Daldinia vernicosa TaxID=114800 RepID=UPI0020085616|nr:uncharacterized protein F5Y00DRAFT_262795 [Daldinia vernicosa]KAI0848160.1 hypothetical protein F5Y00DRAFT_262795 [Daldinia vernicosa]